MKSKMMKKANRKLRKAKMKGNLLMEMAEDFKDLVANAKVYKKLKGKKYYNKNNLNRYLLRLFLFLSKFFSFLFSFSAKY